jgi:virulence factor
MIRIGLVDMDTSHVVQFSRRLNHVGIDREQWVDGAKVVLGVPGTSEITPEETVREYVRQCRDECAVRIVETPEELLGEVEGVFIESQSGAAHLGRALPFLKARLPVFIDKPFTHTVGDAVEIARLANEHETPVFSASSLRYAPEVQAFLTENPPENLLGADVLTPGTTHEKNPGLLHYGIHGVEMLYALMGPGCMKVTCLDSPIGQVATGTWKDGRIGVVRAMAQGAAPFMFIAHTKKGAVTQQVESAFIYRELLKKIVGMMETGESPLDLRETIEIIAFIEAARKSSEQGGAPVSLSYTAHGSGETSG